MKYTVIGQDGKPYGPVDADQIRQWMAQGRVANSTPVFVAGASEWTRLDRLPEFFPAVATPAPAITSLAGQAVPWRPTNQLAVWGLVCGILSWMCCCCCCLPFNLVGLVLSIVALAQINARPEIQEGRGLAIAGIVLSGTNLLWSLGITLMNIIASILNPGAYNGNIPLNIGQN
jgi:hypothetical protein